MTGRRDLSLRAKQRDHLFPGQPSGHPQHGPRSRHLVAEDHSQAACTNMSPMMLKWTAACYIYIYIADTNTGVCSDIGNTNTSIHPVSYCPIWDEAVLIPDLMGRTSLVAKPRGVWG